MNRPLIALPLLLLILLSGGCRSTGPADSQKMRQLFIGYQPARALHGLRHSNSEVRRWSVIRLAREADPRNARAVAALLNPKVEPAKIVRATAAANLPAFGDAQALPALRTACADESPHVRAEAVRALGRLGGAAERDTLVERLRGDRDPGVRMQAAYALERLGDRRAMPHLVAALIDLDESVICAAHSALKTLSGADLPPEQPPWRDWMKENEAL